MTRVVCRRHRAARSFFSLSIATALLMLLGLSGCQTSARSQTALSAPAIAPSFTDDAVQAPVLSSDDAFESGDTARP